VFGKKNFYIYIFYFFAQKRKKKKKWKQKLGDPNGNKLNSTEPPRLRKHPPDRNPHHTPWSVTSACLISAVAPSISKSIFG